MIPPGLVGRCRRGGPQWTPSRENEGFSPHTGCLDAEAAVVGSSAPKKVSETYWRPKPARGRFSPTISLLLPVPAVGQHVGVNSCFDDAAECQRGEFRSGTVSRQHPLQGAFFLNCVHGVVDTSAELIGNSRRSSQRWPSGVQNIPSCKVPTKPEVFHRGCASKRHDPDVPAYAKKHRGSTTRSEPSISVVHTEILDRNAVVAGPVGGDCGGGRGRGGLPRVRLTTDL